MILTLLISLNYFHNSNVKAIDSIYPQPDFQKGFSFIGWGESEFRDERALESLQRLKETGTEWVVLCIFWFQENKSSTEIQPAYDLYSVNTTDVLLFIEIIHDLGLKVVLKPIVDIKTGEWRAYIEPSEEWFEEYSSYISFWAEIAEQKAVELFVVGCELINTESYLDEWLNIIGDVKAFYSGPLVYSATYDSYQNIEFWDELDFIGVNAYYTLTYSTVPTLKELKRGWQKYLTELEDFSFSLTKDIIFTEIGYRSIDGCNIQPWNWQKKGRLDENEQALCYEATFEVFNDISWLKGFYWWNWEAIYTDEDKKNYTPQEKLAEKVLKSWYINSTPYPLKDNQKIWTIILTISISLLISVVVTTIILRKNILKKRELEKGGN